MRNEPVMVLGFPEYDEPVFRLAKALGVPCREIEIHRFPDGESKVRLPTPLPTHAIFCRTLNQPNNKLIELLLAAETARELGSERLTLVAPYMCYMRQDAAFRPGEAISQRIIGRMLADVFDEVITVDPHLHRVRRFDNVITTAKAKAVTAAHEAGAYLSGTMNDPLIVGPDVESQQWVRQIGETYECDVVVGEKIRHDDRSVSFTLPEFAYRGREVVLVDDVASTGSTLVAAAREVMKHDPKTLVVFVTHALFVNDALDRIIRAGVSSVWSSDTILHSSNVVHVATPIAAALKLEAGPVIT